MTVEKITELREKLARKPNALPLRIQLAQLLVAAGRHDEALPEAYRAYAPRKGRRDTLDLLLETSNALKLTEAVKSNLRAVVDREPVPHDLQSVLSQLLPKERIGLLAALFEHCDAIVHVQVPKDGPFEGDHAAGLDADAVRRGDEINKTSREVFPFQRKILESGYLEFPSPFTGEPLRSNVSLLFSGGRPVICYFFQDREPFFVVLNPFSGGKSGLYFPARNAWVSQEPLRGHASTLVYLKALIVAHAAETLRHLSATGPRPLCLLAGMMNHWGHTLLNEFDAWEQCVDQELLSGVETILKGQSNFLGIDELFPDLAAKTFVPAGNMLEAYRAVVDGGYMVVRPTTKYWHSIALRERLVAAAKRHHEQHPIADLDEAARSHPVIWFEIRTNDRIWLNQAEGIISIATRLKAMYPDLRIVLAGWSRKEERSAEDERSIAKDAAVSTAIKEALPADIKVVDLTGSKIIEKIAWGAFAIDAFVVTAGTGMAFPYLIGRKRGIVHSNAALSMALWRDKSEKTWDFAEDAVPFLTMETEFIADENPERHMHVRNHKLDIDALFEKLCRVISESRSGDPARAEHAVADVPE